MKIIRYRNNSDMDVEFLDEHAYIKEHVTYTSFKKGQIKNPYDKTVCGVGYLGVGEYRVSQNSKHTSAYRAWYMMLERCYAEQGKEFFRSYYNISKVCNEWHNFQNFAEWYENNRYECRGRLHVDKDILFPGNKVYCSDTCLLVPQYINALFINLPNKQGLPNGIRKQASERYEVSYRGKSLGTHNTLEDAFEIYSEIKEKYIKKIANKNKEVIPNKIYQALLNYEVKIENDANYKE